MTNKIKTTGREPALAFNGRYCAGSGDAEFLQLVDESFQFFHAGADVPNLTMLYHPDWDTFAEGAGWGAWWIQNAYGFSYCATPFLQEPWISILQRSWDLHWDNQGDGKRKGLGGGKDTAALVAPDGSLGDCALPGKIVYKQGDGDMKIHDWFYEATAAGIIMQAEILLRNRDGVAILKYLPQMARACEFIERERDPKNNLFLVGPASNLLAPSYGGVKMPGGNFGKGYLAGLSISYAAALERMVELYKLTGDQAKLEIFQRRLEITRASLKLLQADGGYFVKSIEPDGTKHGVLGQEKYGYLEGVSNADALAFRVTDDKTAERIYSRIAAFGEIRPFDFLLTNAPGLDDTCWNWGVCAPLEGSYNFGDWVNGGAWGTVEGRALMGYYRLNKFDDIRRSATRAMKWAKDYRMDAPWSQRGENTHNRWSDGGGHQEGGVAVMVDNFAIPAATIRGICEYIYKADGMMLYPHLPPSVATYIQNEPVRFGNKEIYISIANGPGGIKSVRVNGKSIAAADDHFLLEYESLPRRAKVKITMGGAISRVPALQRCGTLKPGIQHIPETLRRPYAHIKAMKRMLKNAKGAAYERSFIIEALGAIEAVAARAQLEPGPGFFRPLTPERKQAIIKFHAMTAMNMYRGLEKRLARYASSDNAREQRLVKLFTKVQK